MGAGDYLVFYRATGTGLHPFKKLVLNVKAPVDFEVSRLNPEELTPAFNELMFSLKDRIPQKDFYQQPNT